MIFDPTSRLSESLARLGNGLQSSEKYCIFARRRSLYAVLAASVREVGLRPKIAVLPHAPALVAGLGHVRNEFLPLVRLLGADESITGSSHELEPQMLVLTSDQGPWGLLVDRVYGLAPLEVSRGSERQSSVGWTSAIMGTATLDHQVVQVLDERIFYRAILDGLQRFWTSQGSSRTQTQKPLAAGLKTS